MDKELFPWLKALYPVWARLDRPALESAVTVAMAELMLSGCTTTTDHHYVFPKGLEDAIDVEVDVAKRLGMRAVLTRGSMNLSERDGGLPPDSVVQDEDTILEDSERLIGTYHQRGDGAMIQIALAPCSPFSVTRSLMSRTAELASRHDVRLHTHLAETEDENSFCLETMGCRPLDYLEECGWLGDRVWLAHGIHFNADEIEPAGRRGCRRDPLRMQQSGAGVGHVPGPWDGKRRGEGRAGGRWIGIGRQQQPDAGGPRRFPAAKAAIRGFKRQPPGRAPLGHDRFGGLYRAVRPWRDSARISGGSGSVPPG